MAPANDGKSGRTDDTSHIQIPINGPGKGGSLSFYTVAYGKHGAAIYGRDETLGRATDPP